ncbi:MAG: hypothetical protein FJZ01_02970 [Candidatus Sericytochromatia bacterium]|nr:hypothetical protein [Candidatus Tanganyikabacteria bacterium]
MPPLHHRLWSACNSLTFGLRSAIRWRVPVRRNRPAPEGPFFGHLADPTPAEALLAAWEERYRFAARHLAEDPETVRDALFILSLVEGALDEAGAVLPDPAAVLDIGAKNWHYVRALWALLAGHGGRRRDVALTGIEIDPFVVYRDGHSRYDWARRYASTCPGARYVPGDALAHREAYDLVLLLFPIMLEEEHLDWGLPLEHFRPADLLAHAYDRVRAGGALVVATYDYECDALRATWEGLGLVPTVWRPHASPVAAYDIGRHVAVFGRSR